MVAGQVIKYVQLRNIRTHTQDIKINAKHMIFWTRWPYEPGIRSVVLFCLGYVRALFALLEVSIFSFTSVCCRHRYLFAIQCMCTMFLLNSDKYLMANFKWLHSIRIVVCLDSLLLLLPLFESAIILLPYYGGKPVGKKNLCMQ